MGKIQTRFVITIEPLIGGKQTSVCVEDCYTNSLHSTYLPENIPLNSLFHIAEAYVTALNEVNAAKITAINQDPTPDNLGF